MHKVIQAEKLERIVDGETKDSYIDYEELTAQVSLA
jgi:hypothetical protein